LLLALTFKIPAHAKLGRGTLKSGDLG